MVQFNHGDVIERYDDLKIQNEKKQQVGAWWKKCDMTRVRLRKWMIA